jgi:hypothetical protein
VAKNRLTEAEAKARDAELGAAGIEVELTAMERARIAAVNAAVPIRIIEPKPGSGTIAFFRERPQ